MSLLMENKIAERVKITNRVREMIEAGVKPEQQDEYDKLIGEFNRLTGEIEDLKKMDEFDNVNPEPIGKPRSEVDGFVNFARTGDPAGIVYNAVTTDTGSAGYLVPTELRNEIIEVMQGDSAMTRLADVIDTKSITDIPVDGTAPTAYWVGEEGAFTDSSPTVGRIVLAANKIGVMVKVSEELLADSAFDVGAYLTQKSGQAIGRLGEEAFIGGTVSGRPTGILASTWSFGLTSSVTASFGYADLVDLWAGVKTAYAKKGSWLTERATLAKIMTLKDSDNTFIFKPSYKEGQPDMLLGRKLETSEYMPALTTSAKAIAFGDFSYYKIGIRGGITMQRLNELYAGTGHVGFRFWVRLDGKMSVPEAVKYLSCK